MRNFLNTLYNTGLIKEQDAAPAPAQETEVDVNVSETEPTPTEEVIPLSPESEVLLVRMLKKALVMKIDSDDITEISNFADINEKNAKQVLQQLINIMKNYSLDVDID